MHAARGVAGRRPWPSPLLLRRDGPAGASLHGSPPIPAPERRHRAAPCCRSAHCQAHGQACAHRPGPASPPPSQAAASAIRGTAAAGVLRREVVAKPSPSPPGPGGPRHSPESAALRRTSAAQAARRRVPPQERPAVGRIQPHVPQLPSSFRAAAGELLGSSSVAARAVSRSSPPKQHTQELPEELSSLGLLKALISGSRTAAVGRPNPARRFTAHDGKLQQGLRLTDSASAYKQRVPATAGGIRVVGRMRPPPRLSAAGGGGSSQAAGHGPRSSPVSPGHLQPLRAPTAQRALEHRVRPGSLGSAGFAHRDNTDRDAKSLACAALSDGMQGQLWR